MIKPTEAAKLYYENIEKNKDDYKQFKQKYWGKLSQELDIAIEDCINMLISSSNIEKDKYIDVWNLIFQTDFNPTTNVLNLAIEILQTNYWTVIDNQINVLQGDVK